MGEERVNRKLAAILTADVVDYSRLMGADGDHHHGRPIRGDLPNPVISAQPVRAVAS